MKYAKKCDLISFEALEYLFQFESERFFQTQ